MKNSAELVDVQVLPLPEDRSIISRKQFAGAVAVAAVLFVSASPIKQVAGYFADNIPDSPPTYTEDQFAKMEQRTIKLKPGMFARGAVMKADPGLYEDGSHPSDLALEIEAYVQDGQLAHNNPSKVIVPVPPEEQRYEQAIIDEAVETYKQSS